MDIVYYIESDFDCVFLINGAFREQAGLFNYPAKSPLYITVLPLSALLLPYTAKIVGGRPIGNQNLLDCYSAGGTRFLIRLKARHNYVYSPVAVVNTAPQKGTAFDLFRSVKNGELFSARALMTRSLSDSIDDAALTAFFAPYTEIIPNKFTDIRANFLLVNKERECEAFNFTFSGSLIDNIEGGGETTAGAL